MKGGQMAKNILTLCITLLVMVILAEAVLWLLAPIDDPYRLWKEGQVVDYKFIESQFQPDQHYTFYPEPELSGMGEIARFTTNNLGFRGDNIGQPKPPDEFRVFMVGGSTTECAYLDDTSSVTAVLEYYLAEHFSGSHRVKVYGAGKSGDRSYDHLAMIGQRITHLQPDLVIVFCGLNDLTAAIYNADYLHFPQNYGARISFLDQTKYLLTEFQFPRRLYHAYKGILKSQTGDDLLTSIRFKSHYKELVKLRKSSTPTDRAPATDITSYRNNLTSIVGLVRAHNVELVFMTQAVTWNSKVDPKVTDWVWATHRNGVTYREDLMDMAMTAYNDAMRAAAEENDIPVFDLARMIPKSLAFFYDDCHFNIKGAERAATMLGAFLIDNGVDVAKPKEAI
jgi:lysophospholipase L1-like esterase